MDDILKMLTSSFVDQLPNKEAVAVYQDATVALIAASKVLQVNIENAASRLEEGLPVDEDQAKKYQEAFIGFRSAEAFAHSSFHALIGTSPDHERNEMDTLAIIAEITD